MSRLLLIFVLFFQLCSGSQTVPASTQISTPGRQLVFKGTLSFVDVDRTISKIDIALADDDMSRSQGLMDVRSMKDDGGMLFIFDVQERQSFWMANTPLPLDLIFADENFNIVHIHHNAAPYSRSGIDSLEPAKYVIEVNAGYAVKNDLRAGMTFTYSLY
jgi:uncharacterized protein